MKILTVCQPWASLIALGAKKIETRSWRTNYRGPVAIHAATGLKAAGGELGFIELCHTEPFLSAFAMRGMASGGLVDRFQFPRGAIVAVARLVECEEITELHIQQGGWLFADGRCWPLTDQERAFGDYTPGRCAWLLADVRPLRKPVPHRGAQGLRDAPADVQATIEAQL